MEGGALFIGIFGFAAVAAYLKAKSEMAEKQRLFEAQKLILDKLGSAAEVNQFLASDQGREFFDRLKSPEEQKDVRDTGGQTAYGMLIGSVLTLSTGVAFVVAVNLTQIDDLYIPAAICIAVGIGLLIGSAITRYVWKRWNVCSSNGDRLGTRVS